MSLAYTWPPPLTTSNFGLFLLFCFCLSWCHLPMPFLRATWVGVEGHLSVRVKLGHTSVTQMPVSQVAPRPPPQRAAISINIFQNGSRFHPRGGEKLQDPHRYLQGTPREVRGAHPTCLTKSRVTHLSADICSRSCRSPRSLLRERAGGILLRDREKLSPATWNSGLVQGRDVGQGQRDVSALACEGSSESQGDDRLPAREPAETPGG